MQYLGYVECVRSVSRPTGDPTRNMWVTRMRELLEQASIFCAMISARVQRAPQGQETMWVTPARRHFLRTLTNDEGIHQVRVVLSML